MSTTNLAQAESRLRKLLDRFRTDLVDGTIYGVPSLTWPGAKRHDYFVAIKRGKAAVSLYLIIADRYPEDIATASPELQATRSGRATFAFRSLDDEMASDLADLLDRLFDRYRAEHAAKTLKSLGVGGVLLQLARDGQILDVRCEMPQCYCIGGRRHFDPKSTSSDWRPTPDHYPRLKSDGGRLTPDNVRLAHLRCNQRDFEWRTRINAMLAKRMSLVEIAERLNAQKVATIHGVNRWTPGAVRKAFIS